jgi:hypothetical protein
MEVEAGLAFVQNPVLLPIVAGIVGLKLAAPH